MARSSGGSAAASSKKSKATSAAIKSTPSKKAKKTVKKDPSPAPAPAPAPLEESDDDLQRAEPFKETFTSKRDRMVRKIHCAIPDGTSAVLRKKQKREFTQNIELSSKKPFSLEPVLMTHGPYAGLHVLVLQPEPDENEKFPFLDLPAEIRNMIYSLVLERSDYHIHLSGKHSGTIQARWYKPGCGFISRWDRPYSSSLMRVNKQISAESSPYLFSRHIFEFTDSTMMQRFLEYIGSERTKSLISVRVNQLCAVSVRQAFNLLSPAVSLAKLHLRGIYTYGYAYHTHNFTSLLLPLFQSLYSAGRSRDDVLNIIDIPGAVNGSCQKHGVFHNVIDEDCEKEKTAYADFYKKLRDDIEKEIDKAKAKKEAIKRGSPVKTRAGRKTKAVDYSGMED